MTSANKASLAGASIRISRSVLGPRKRENGARKIFQNAGSGQAMVLQLLRRWEQCEHGFGQAGNSAGGSLK